VFIFDEYFTAFESRFVTACLISETSPVAFARLLILKVILALSSSVVISS
jgi:hypothetical protein